MISKSLKHVQCYFNISNLSSSREKFGIVKMLREKKRDRKPDRLD